MKKIVVLLLLFMTLHVSAQEINFIPKVGLNLASTTNLDLGYRPGINVGCGVEFMFNKHFGIEPGVYYSTQGGKGDVSEYFYHNYINIPVFAKGYLYKGFFVEAGPQVGFQVHSDWVSIDMKEYTNVVDFSLGVGIGYQMDWGMMVSLNGNFGLTSVFNKNYKKLFEDEDYKSSHNSVIQLNIGWKF